MASKKKPASKSTITEPNDEHVAQPQAIEPHLNDEPAEPRTGPTLSDAAASYLAGMDADGAGDGTLSSYEAELKLAMRGLGETTLLSDLTPDRVGEYFASDLVMKTKTGKPKARPTFLKTQRVLRLALVSAQTKGLIAVAPLPVSKTAAV